VAQLNARSSDWEIAWRLALVGIGQGFFMTPNARALMNAAPAGEQGESSGLLATGRVLGQSLSVALAGAIFAGLGGAEAGRDLVSRAINHAVPPTDEGALQATFLTSFHTALLVCACVAAAGIVTALIRAAEADHAMRPAALMQPSEQNQDQNPIYETAR
jgi:uncharacterized protein (DUF697 family)